MTRTTGLCARCSRPLLDGHCADCVRQSESTFVHREIVALVVLCALVVMGFVLTRAAATANRALHGRDADAFYRAGEQHLQRGRTTDAIRAFRHAAAISRENRTYQLALAAGLAADRQDDSARQILLGVRNFSPEDPEVNVRLAHLEARHDDLTKAVRYYQNAVYGAWSEGQSAARQDVRIELIRYLLAHHENGRALSELLVLIGNLPDDVKSQNEAGQLLLEAGDAERALDRFRRALRIDPANTTALAGAGEAAFAVGDYVAARRYLRAVTSVSAVADLLTVAELVLARDPLRPGLVLRQRHERVTAGLQRATAMVDECSHSQPSQSAALESLRAEAIAFQAQFSLQRARRNPEAIDSGLDLIYRIESRATELCGQGSPVDRALVLIGRRHKADRE